MASNVHFLRRRYELKHQIDFQLQVEREMDMFIRKTNKFVLSKVAISMETEKINEATQDLLKLEEEIDVYYNYVHRISRVKVKHWERQHLDGQRSDIVGKRRKIIRKLKKLKSRVRKLRYIVESFKPKEKAQIVEQTLQQIGNYQDPETGIIKTEAGGDLIVCITLLLAFFAELRRKKNEKI